jgi:hypothetical protein
MGAELNFRKEAEYYCLCRSFILTRMVQLAEFISPCRYIRLFR